MSSIIFAIPSNGDKTLILDTRASFLQAFKAINWTDLRLTIACSLTSQSANDQQSGLGETYGSAGDSNHFYMGFKSSDNLLPTQTNFWGLSSNTIAAPTAAAQLYDNITYFQPGNTSTLTIGLLASNGTTKTNSLPGQGNGPEFLENAVPQPSYAQVIFLRMRRNDPTLPVVNTLEAVVDAPSTSLGLGPHWVSDTTIATLRSQTAAATFNTIISPFTFAAVPDAIYFFWPFNNSRLRIHSYVLEKYA